jgi:hypothetical protein
MSASDEIKDELVSHFSIQGVDTAGRDWKRRSKEAVGDYVVRRFENTVAGLSVLAVTVDEEDGIDSVSIWETGPIGFAIVTQNGASALRFTPMSHWERTHSWPSLDDYAHHERGIRDLPLRYCGSDCGDNMFSVLTEHIDSTRADLVASGYTDLTDRA